MNASARLPAAGPQVARVEDRNIPGPGGLDPRCASIGRRRPQATPGIYVYLHSGAYVAYNLDTADPGCRVIANAVQLRRRFRRLPPRTGGKVSRRGRGLLRRR